ncbi:MAG: hypothetical protein QXE15_02470 [Candidatus Bathyarchaeia archaeon]
MKMKGLISIFLILTFLTLHPLSIKALNLNYRVENAINWILTRKTSEPEGFLTIDNGKNRLYVEEHAFIISALILYRKTFTSNRYDEEIKTTLKFILSSQNPLKKDYYQYYDLGIGEWRISGKLFYWNAYIIEAVSYSAFQIRYYGNLNESELAYWNQAIYSIKSFLNFWEGAQKNDGSWVFEYNNTCEARLSENSALLTGLLYLAIYEWLWGNKTEALKFIDLAEKTLDWILSLQEVNSKSWGYGGFYQTIARNIQDSYSNAKAAFALNSYLRVIPPLKTDFKSKYYKVRDALTIWVEGFVEKMLDEFYGIYNSRSLLRITNYPKSVVQASLMISALIETWIDMGDSKYRDLADKILKWLTGENEFKKDLQSPQGAFYKEIQKTKIVYQFNLSVTALALSALLNSILIGIPEINFIQPTLTLTLMLTIAILLIFNKLKCNS